MKIISILWITLILALPTISYAGELNLDQYKDDGFIPSKQMQLDKSVLYTDFVDTNGVKIFSFNREDHVLIVNKDYILHAEDNGMDIVIYLNDGDEQ